MKKYLSKLILSLALALMLVPFLAISTSKAADLNLTYDPIPATVTAGKSITIKLHMVNTTSGTVTLLAYATSAPSYGVADFSVDVPAGANIETMSGTQSSGGSSSQFTWTTDPAMTLGSHPITFEVADSTGALIGIWTAQTTVLAAPATPANGTVKVSDSKDQNTGTVTFNTLYTLPAGSTGSPFEVRYFIYHSSSGGTGALPSDWLTNGNATLKDSASQDTVNTTSFSYDYIWDTSGTPAGQYDFVSAIYNGSDSSNTNSSSYSGLSDYACVAVAGGKITTDCNGGAIPIKGTGPGGTVTSEPFSAALPWKDISKHLQYTDIDQLISDLITIWFPLIIGVLAFIGIIAGGFMFLTSGGDEKMAEKGKKTLAYSAIAIFVMALSWTIVYLVINDIINKYF